MEAGSNGLPGIFFGLESEFIRLPASISIGKRTYYLIRRGGDYQLLSSVCPHQGSEVVHNGDLFECPNHGWKFDHNGNCINVSGHCLASLPVVVREGKLYALLDLVQIQPAALKQARREKFNVAITLHSHACLEIAHQGFAILTDPWLNGPAFLGSWTQYPPPIVKASSLRPDAIVISHEHSDHFHEPTLRQMDRSIPVYVPDFSNRRLVDRLQALGFIDVKALGFGETSEIGPGFRITFFEPESFWNDSLVLLEAGDFKLLNINDAGLNHRIASYIGPVDAIASQFSQGASSYPLTWDHVAHEDKIDIMDRACDGKLTMLKEAMRLYQADYLIPFASHFALWHPSHREYAKVMRMNTPDNVVESLGDTDVTVIDLLPGETWQGATGEIERKWYNRQRLYERSTVLRNLERWFDDEEFDTHHPPTADLSVDGVAQYFLRLNDAPEIAMCEDLTVEVSATEGLTDEVALCFAFEVREGCLSPLDVVPEDVNLKIKLPIGILSEIVRQNVSWDEAHIGYWCRFSRSPDVYHAGFWRLLQAPYFKKRPAMPRMGEQGVTESTIVADIIEKHGVDAERILRRYGLYCVGCQHSTFDSLGIGARQHGIELRQVDRMIKELNRLIEFGRFMLCAALLAL